MRTALALAAAAAALAGCNPDRSCRSDADCGEPDERCRPGVLVCAGDPSTVTLVQGFCRSVNGICSTEQDCVPGEDCRSVDTRCHPKAACDKPPGVDCQQGCGWNDGGTSSFPCACVCDQCPAAAAAGG